MINLNLTQTTLNTSHLLQNSIDNLYFSIFLNIGIFLYLLKQDEKTVLKFSPFLIYTYIQISNYNAYAFFQFTQDLVMLNIIYGLLGVLIALEICILYLDFLLGLNYKKIIKKIISNNKNF